MKTDINTSCFTINVCICRISNHYYTIVIDCYTTVRVYEKYVLYNIPNEWNSEKNLITTIFTIVSLAINSRW